MRVPERATHRVVGAILRRRNRLLLCHRHPDREWYPDVWDVPGGHVEPCETPSDALVRELREELGVELSLPLGSPFGQLTDAATQIEMTIWLIDYDGAVANRSPEEHDEVRWIAAHEISGLALAHSGYAAIFDRALRT